MKLTTKKRLGIAAAITAAIVAIPSAAWAAYDNVYCDVSLSNTPCTTAAINPHSTQNWLRYLAPSGTAIEILDHTTGDNVVANNGSGLVANGQWHTWYNLNASHTYHLKVYVGFSSGGRSRLANCTTLPNGNPC